MNGESRASTSNVGRADGNPVYRGRSGWRTRERSEISFSTFASRKGYEARAWNQAARTLCVVYRGGGCPSPAFLRGPDLIRKRAEATRVETRFRVARLTLFFAMGATI
jgi:hypothetical protein